MGAHGQPTTIRVYATWADMPPLVSRWPPHLLSPKPPAAAAVAVAAVEVSTRPHRATLDPLPLRTADVPTSVLQSRGFSYCCTSQLTQGYHRPCVQPRVKTSTTIVVQQPFLHHQWWVATNPHRTPVVPRGRGWS